MKRIGLFGGTFNPVHLGHLWAAEAVLDEFGFNGMIFIPSATPPHKAPEGVVPARDRAEMLRLALAGTPYEISDVELTRRGHSFTIDTVRHFQTTSGEDTFYLLVGLDAFVEMDTWKSYLDLFSSISMVVMPRPFPSANEPDTIRALVDDFLKKKVSADYRFSEKDGAFSHPHGLPIHLFFHDMLDISATGIREKVRQGDTIDALVPAPEKDYILNKGLYR